MGAMLLVMSVVSAFHKKPAHAGDVIGRVFGAAIIFSIPLGIAAFGGLIASTVLLGIGAPAITYAFIGPAALVCFGAAVRHPGLGMDGCTQMFGLVASGSALIWCGVSLAATGGLASDRKSVV